MKKTLFFLLLFAIHFSFAQEDNYYPLSLDWNAFQTGKTYFAFGHNVKLRKGPSTDDEVITLIAIGGQVEILKARDETFHIDGYDSRWYQVKVGEKTGYVVGALLAMQGIEVANQRFLFTKNQGGLVVRAIIGAGTYTELTMATRGNVAGVKVYGNRGLSGVKHVLYIDYQGNCCGCEMGGSYLFYDGKQLFHAIDALASGDIDFVEEVIIIFPADNKDLASNKIIYRRRDVEIKEEATNWQVEQITSRELEWRDGKFFPEDFRKNR